MFRALILLTFAVFCHPKTISTPSHLLLLFCIVLMKKTHSICRSWPKVCIIVRVSSAVLLSKIYDKSFYLLGLLFFCRLFNPLFIFFKSFLFHDSRF